MSVLNKSKISHPYLIAGSKDVSITRQIDRSMVSKSELSITGITEVVLSVMNEVIADAYKDINMQDLKSGWRKREAVLIRQMAMFFIRKFMPKTPLKSIGMFFGGRDHSTVIHAVQQISDQLYIKDKLVTECHDRILSSFSGHR